ncbi:hypothetical protein [Streptosporangium pseudovulgare]|uniref:Uncharacterized protein n=1 Tax=Streptosporangium pseudovulgare TaxID=35765 RepID=A0ABQ2RJK0_9ACTN|nr:hypothetical protein [Streptosporangium pseudovulgare]GGQ31375.1 hypothetical protein GCM10010140_71850 [Streptosporangium pseudovulgare]
MNDHTAASLPPPGPDPGPVAAAPAAGPAERIAALLLDRAHPRPHHPGTPEDPRRPAGLTHQTLHHLTGLVAQARPGTDAAFIVHTLIALLESDTAGALTGAHDRSLRDLVGELLA